jgi:Fur family peroxide stress response transcriptional regulator
MKPHRDKKYKLTPQRQAILQCLEGNKDHPSAVDIYRKVKRRFPTMSFATVYNNLEILLEKGSIRSLTIDPERKRYDPDITCHHHIICQECKRIVDVYADLQVSIPEDQKDDYDVTGSHIEFYGLCPECNKERQ